MKTGEHFERFPACWHMKYSLHRSRYSRPVMRNHARGAIVPVGPKEGLVVKILPDQVLIV